MFVIWQFACVQGGDRGRTGHLARLELGQGEAVDRGGAPDVPAIMDAICQFFLLTTMT